MNLNPKADREPRESALIRPATPSDLLSVITLERQCASAAHWTEQQYEKILHAEPDLPARRLWVAERSGAGYSTQDSAADSKVVSGILGFLTALHCAPEWELENIVVAPEARLAGIGKQLLNRLLATARETNSPSVFLEVRESNMAARSLYEKAGFQQTGRRKAYYTNPQEDAVLYTWLESRNPE